MAEYRRFVAYIYDYGNGKRGNNTGFAKIESQGGICKMQIQMKNIPAEEVHLDIYGLVQMEKCLLGIFLGRIALGEGDVQIRIGTPAEHIGESEYALSDMAGLMFMGEHNGRFATVWVDEEVDLETFVTELPEAQNAEKSGSGDTMSVSRNEVQAADAEVQAADAEVQAADAEVQAADAKVQAADTEVHAQEAAACVMPRAICPNYRFCTTLDQRWACFSGRYAHMVPFVDENVEDGVQICPRDLQVLSRETVNTGQNSFVLHGYYTYRHLILGKCRDGSYILAVPGIYDNQERFMANMFGYSEFRDAKQPRRTGRFGYWCRKISD